MHMKSRSTSRAFTVIELLVVIGIIGVLIGISIPFVQGARRSSTSTLCQNNLRQLAVALLGYAAQNDGRFPPNNGATGLFWFDLERVLEPFAGVKVKPEERQGSRSILICPADSEASVRSYSMNVFASSAVSELVRKSLVEETPPRGKMFSARDQPSSKLILLIESTSLPTANNPDLSASPAIVGWGPRYPGHRFGAAPATQRWWQVDYSRHAPQGRGNPEEPAGRLHIAFLDGHVGLFSHNELADFTSTRSRYVALWSSNDAAAEATLPGDPKGHVD
jgi:prepilin-type N-terminal cleavage/methylation domain-containing protein/prepilin-type processing-associated H-X9-DG protein